MSDCFNLTRILNFVFRFPKTYLSDGKNCQIERCIEILWLLRFDEIFFDRYMLYWTFGPRISSYTYRFEFRKAIHIQCPKYIGVKIVPKYAFCCTKRWYWNFHQGISHSDAVIFLYQFWMNRWIDIKKDINTPLCT